MAVYDHLTDTHAQCWVHDGRHYAKLAPRVPHHQALLASTAAKLGVSLLLYLRDRLTRPASTPAFTARIALRAVLSAGQPSGYGEGTMSPYTPYSYSVKIYISMYNFKSYFVKPTLYLLNCMPCRVLRVIPIVINKYIFFE
jgi:hypothetical protein